jgi:hypothetical protein
MTQIEPNSSLSGKFLTAKVTATNVYGSSHVYSKSNCDAFLHEVCPNNHQYEYFWMFDNVTADANHIVSVVNQPATLSVSYTQSANQNFELFNYGQSLSCQEANLVTATRLESSRFNLTLGLNTGVHSSALEIVGTQQSVSTTVVTNPDGSRKFTSTFTIPQGTPSMTLICDVSGGSSNKDGSGGEGDGFMFPLRIKGS